MKVSDAGLALIKEFEGLRLRAYPDPATGGEPWTIGVGHTGGVRPGDVITEQQAMDYLREDVVACEICVQNAVTVELTQSQFDALCSFVFNCGCAALKTSTLLRMLNGRDYEGAADQFLRWDKAAGKVMPGLTRRRKAEREMFLSGGQNVS